MIHLLIDSTNILLEPITAKSKKIGQDFEDAIKQIIALSTHIPLSVGDLATMLDELKAVLEDIDDSFSQLQGLGVPMNIIPIVEEIQMAIAATIPVIRVLSSLIHIVAKG